MKRTVQGVPERSRVPARLAWSSLAVVAASTVWGFVARSSSATVDAAAAPGGVAAYVGLVPSAVAVLSTLAIIAWVRDRRRVARRRRIVRRLNAASASAASVLIDIDLLEAGSPFGREGVRDVFDALELEARQLLEEGETLRTLALAGGWREPRHERVALDDACAHYVFDCSELWRKAHDVASTESTGPGTADKSGEAFGSRWEVTARSIWDELERSLSLLVEPFPGQPTGVPGSSLDTHARVRALQRRFGERLVSPELADPATADGEPRPTDDSLADRRREAATETLGRLSTLLGDRLDRSGEPNKRERAEQLAATTLAHAPAPWLLVGAPVVTPDALAVVAGDVLARERSHRRSIRTSPGFEVGHDTIRAGATLVGIAGGGAAQLFFLGVVAPVIAVIGIGGFFSGTLLSLFPELRSGAWLPWVGPLSGVLLALIPWGVTGLVFLLGEGGAVARTDSRRRAEAALDASKASLSAVVARWDDTLLALAAAHPGPGNAESFSRREAALDAAQLAALRTFDALDSTPAGEREEEEFLAESLGLREDLEVLTARQRRILEGPGDTGAPPRL